MGTRWVQDGYKMGTRWVQDGYERAVFEIEEILNSFDNSKFHQVNVISIFVCFSPYSGKRLKPFIRRDFDIIPAKLKVLRDIQV